MSESIKAYSLGKRIETLHDSAKRAIFACFSTEQQSKPVAYAMIGFVFEENMGNEKLPAFLAEHGHEIEGCVDTMLGANGELKELVSIALFLKHNLCRAYGNKTLYTKMLTSPIFKKYCDCKFNPTSEELDRLQALIHRVGRHE